MTNLITHTHIGPVIITHRDLVELSDDRYGTTGSIALGILVDHDGKPECWTLIWEWGGDWMGFADGQQYDADQLDDWEPQAIKEAIGLAIDLGLANIESDMEWFESWADTAQETIDNRD